MFKKQIKRHKKYYGFTLVELIIVITILAILATISFVSFSGYTANSRDSNRLFSLKEISKSLTMQKEMTGNFPQPDEVYAKGGIPNLDNELFSVGLIGKNVSNYVKLGGIPLDPKTGSEYLYGLTRDNKNFQIAGTLENLQSSIIIEKAYANSGLEAVVEGDYKGVIRFTHDNKNYIGNIPSLIFSRTGTYSIEKTFVINKGKNLPYSLDGKNLGTGLTPELVLKELHNKDNLVLTGVVITNTKSETEIKQISDKLGVSDMIVADSLGNKQYASSGGSSGGGTPPIVTIPTVDGECGTSNNQNLSVTPTDNLCNKGTASEVSGAGPWSWTCIGEGTTKGTDASCSATKSITCPTGYVLVPGNHNFTYSDGSPTKDFCVMKYEAKINGNDNGNTTYNSSFIAESRPSGTPWGYINQQQAITECNSLGAGYHLITNNEWMTIARNIEQEGDNWSGGSVGNGGLYRGITGEPNSITSLGCGGFSSSQAASVTDSTLWGSAKSNNCESKRQHKLSNGEIIWDLSGNSWTHVNKANTLDGNGFETGINPSLCPINTSRNQWSSCTNKTFGSSNSAWGAAQGLGQVYQADGNIFIRGGFWNGKAESGIFALNLNNSADLSTHFLGFRCTFTVK